MRHDAVQNPVHFRAACLRCVCHGRAVALLRNIDAVSLTRGVARLFCRAGLGVSFCATQLSAAVSCLHESFEFKFANPL
jgi:hypothetical protein